MADPNAPIPTTLWSAHSTSTPPPDLRDVLSQLGHTLSQLNYTKTLAALLKEAEKKGDAAPQAEEWGKSIEVDRAVDLLAMWEVWREKNNGKLPTLRINAAKQKRKEKEKREMEEGKSSLVPTPHAEESSSEESSGSDSDEDEDDEMVDKAAVESGSDDSSSEGSSSEEDSSDEEEEVEDAKVGAKRKRVLTPESESESSSSEDGSTSSSESEDDAPPAKRAKTVETEADSSSDSSSSDSDSDSDENAGVAVPPTTPAAKAKAAASASSSSSSSASSSDSSSSSSSDSEASPPPPPSTKNPKKKTKAPAAPKPKSITSDSASAASSTTLPNSPTKPPAATTNLDHDELLVSVPALNALDAPSSTSETGGVMHPDRLRRLHPNDDGGSGGKSFVRMPATEENVKKMKKGNVPFSRVPKDTVVDEKFRSNEYVSYEYADRAYQDLSVTKGKGFTKEKNKKKRGEFGSVSAFRESVVCGSFGSPVLDVMDDEDLVGKVFLLVEETDFSFSTHYPRFPSCQKMAVVPDMSRSEGLKGPSSGGRYKTETEEVVKEKEIGEYWESEGWETENELLPHIDGTEEGSHHTSTIRERRRMIQETKRFLAEMDYRQAKLEGRLSMRRTREHFFRAGPSQQPSSERKEGEGDEPKPKHLYTRENPRKGEPPGSKPDHEMTKQQVRDKRDWIDMARRDLSLSLVQYSDEVSSSDDGSDGDGPSSSDDEDDGDNEENPDDVGEDFDDEEMPDFDELEALGAALLGPNPMGLKDSTFEFMNGVGFNPMTGKFR
ncbi:jun-like transcription factor [Elasticomyces elasticus]|uniref:Jun-like transcription factor n=1 Tax=Elasticomyces elasticus TaxID=574655 RepID=A0AAN7VR46_9PEZI|nr:jun-like transcription factor [Elasticomyces elasticus]